MGPSLACLNMIKQQLRTNNILNEDILAMFSENTRHQYIPEPYQDFTFADMHIPLDHHQIMLTPLEEAKILQTGKFNANDVILEIGTGSGFSSYLLSKVCHKVVSIDIYADFIEHAKKIHQVLQVDNVELLLQDVCNLQEFPYLFDAIICTSGLDFIPNQWFKLLKPQGKIFAPIGEIVQQAQWLHVNEQKVIGHELVFQTKTPMLINHQPAKFIF